MNKAISTIVGFVLLLAMVTNLAACNMFPMNPLPTSSTNSTSSSITSSTTSSTSSSTTTTTTGATSTSCQHVWERVTTAPTCVAEGYDTVTCINCKESYVENITPVGDHTVGTNWEAYDENYHVLKCSVCGEMPYGSPHTLDENGVCTVCQYSSGATAGIIYDISADGTYAEVIGYEGTSNTIVIASEYNGLPVKGIYDRAFLCKSNITSVVIPEGVEYIGVSAFSGCSNISTITIPSTMKRIGNYAFMGIQFPKVYITDLSSWCKMDMGTYVIDLGYSLYLNNEIIRDLVIPSDITVIKDYTFENCDSIFTVTMHDNVQSIGKNAFAYSGNISNVVFSENLKSIGEYAFASCDLLQAVSLPNKLETIYSNSFIYCYNLEYNEYENALYLGNESNPFIALISVENKNYSKYTIHNQTRIIVNDAFSGCSRVGEIEIPSSVVSIGSGAFSYCSSLTTVKILGNVKRIESNTFGSCNKLTTVILPGSLEYVNNEGFMNSGNITTVYYMGSASNWEKIDMQSHEIRSATIVYNYVP